MINSLKYKLDQLRMEGLSEAERRQILSLFHQPEMEYLLKDGISQQLADFDDPGPDRFEADAEFEQIWKHIEKERLKRKQERVKIQTVFYWCAAVLVLGLVMGILIPRSLWHTDPSMPYTAIAPKGSVAEVILPDSTHLFLNAGSRISYHSGKGNSAREVFLNGEAWFDVKQVDQVPFVVHTEFYDIQVLGTKFNVKAYDEDRAISTTLEKGEIRVFSSGKFQLEKEVILKPGEQLTYEKQEHRLTVRQVNSSLISAWKENKLVFINMSLRDLIVLLERKYGVEITTTDPDILKYHYDGTLKNETILDVLNILRETLPVNYVIDDQKIKIFKK